MHSLVLDNAAHKPALKPNFHVLAHYTIALPCDRVHLETKSRSLSSGPVLRHLNESSITTTEINL